MNCEICEKRCEQTVKVFVKGSDERQLCYACVVRLRTKRLYHNEKQQRYKLKIKSRKNGLLRGRISRDHRLPKG